MFVNYEVHWAYSNRADQVVALRRGAQKHSTHEAAELEARSITPMRANLVTIVVEVRSSKPGL